MRSFPLLVKTSFNSFPFFPSLFLKGIQCPGLDGYFAASVHCSKGIPQAGSTAILCQVLHMYGGCLSCMQPVTCGIIKSYLKKADICLNLSTFWLCKIYVQKIPSVYHALEKTSETSKSKTIIFTSIYMFICIYLDNHISFNFFPPQNDSL